MWGGTDERQSIAAIQASIDEGVSLIDTAPAYGKGLAEEIVGKAIRGRRDKVVLATKCGLVWHTTKGNHFFDYDGKPVHRHLGAESIAYEVEQSLRRLGTDYIDLYITHWQDPTTPIAETMEALEKLKRQGKIRAIGASNLSAAELEAYVAAGRSGRDPGRIQHGEARHRGVAAADLPPARRVDAQLLVAGARPAFRDAWDRTGCSTATTSARTTRASRSPTGRRWPR